MIEHVTHKDLADIRERLARIEEKMNVVADNMPSLLARVTAVERWKIQLMTIVSAVTAIVTYFAVEIKRMFLH